MVRRRSLFVRNDSRRHSSRNVSCRRWMCSSSVRTPSDGPAYSSAGRAPAPAGNEPDTDNDEGSGTETLDVSEDEALHQYIPSLRVMQSNRERSVLCIDEN